MAAAPVLPSVGGITVTRRAPEPGRTGRARGCTMSKPVLEPAAQAFVEATDAPPFLYQLDPADGRKAVDEAQSPEIELPGTDKETLTVPGGPSGTLSLSVFRPIGVPGPLPVILYIHGAGWVFGNDHTHGRLARELARGVGAA